MREFRLSEGVSLYCFPAFRSLASSWVISVWTDLGLPVTRGVTRGQARLWLERAGLMNGITRRAA
jgi:hypothetical protein